MTEQVKVFKNVHTQTPTYGAAFELTLASTSATQKAVIKEVNCKDVGIATLVHDGRTIASGTQVGDDIIASGSLIMDSNSELKLKFSAKDVPQTASFKAMVFSNGSDGINYIEGTGVGNGLATEATSVVNRSTSGNNAYSAVAAIKPGETDITYFRYYGNTIYEYNSTSTSAETNYSFGSGQGLATDGTYLYNIPSGSTTTIYRRHLGTGVADTLTTQSTVYGQQANQGSFLLYHDGYLYTKQEGGASTMYIIKLSDMSVTQISNGNVGSYSDGATIVTNTDGKSFVVEQGTSRWGWYEIGSSATQFTAGSGGSQSSTEYGNGGFEIAPGIAFILGEESDDLSIIDMNQSPPTWQHIASPSARNILVHDNIGNYFAVAHYLVRQIDEQPYDAYTSGVLIEE